MTDPWHTALSAYQSGDLAAAETLCRRVLETQPERAEAQTLMGNLLKRRGQLEQALVHHREAVRLAPNSAAALSDLASALLVGGQGAQALELFARVARECPQVAAVHANLGTALQTTGRIEEASASYRRALSIDGANVPALCNLGSCLRSLGQPAEAVDLLRQALAHAPNHLDAEWNLALALLMDGQLAEGWARYEVRRRLPGFSIEAPDAPAWDGQPAAGATLLVHGEQGLGDTLQFLRYLPAARRRVARLAFECQALLARLLRDVSGPDEVLPRGEARPAVTFEAPLMSLPHLLGPEEGAPDVPPRNLVADPQRIAVWRDRLQELPGRRVGIVWQGSPTYKADHQRSIPLAAFGSLASIEGHSWISLQKTHGLDQLGQWPESSRLTTFDQPLDDGADAFLDTLAIVHSLDLVLSTDTAVAHLAALAGKEVWLLLPAVPDWRWGLAGETTPWYPTMRLFRQREAGNWQELFERVGRALRTGAGSPMMD